MKKHIKNYVKDSKPEDEPVTFNRRAHLLTFAQWHLSTHKGTMHAEGLKLPCLMEKTLRTPMKEGIITEYHIEPIDYDFMGWCKYMHGKSWALITYEGKTESWPLTMVYIKRSEGENKTKI